VVDIKPDAGLRIIFSFFLGLMLTAFIGVGVYTFHAPPEQFEHQIRDLSRREQAIRLSGPANELTAAERDQIQDIDRQRSELVDAAAEARKPWVRSTSVVLIVLATLAMAISLVRADQLPVISNGLLLGGVFTMLYGVGWIVATDSSITRFLVMSAALVITLGLGYTRFVRRDKTPPTAPDSRIAGVAEDVGLANIERRVQDLEGRMNRAASALAHDHGDSRAT
jgi:hypothetical protein